MTNGEDTTLSPVKSAAADPRTIAPPTKRTDEFYAFIASLGLKYFQAREYAFLGANNAIKDSPGFQKNRLPPQSLWPNIVEAAHVMDRLRADLKASIYLTNIYRSEAYNAAIKGVQGSLHTQFKAVDFYCADGNKPAFWAAKLKEYRSEGMFSGGIGIYTSKNFVHLDTRGENKDFGA